MHKKSSGLLFPLVLAFGACLLCSLAAAAGNAPQAEKTVARPPAIVFAEQSHDFGDQPPSTSPRHTFSFKNTGDETLLIEKVKAG